MVKAGERRPRMLTWLHARSLRVMTSQGPQNYNSHPGWCILFRYSCRCSSPERLIAGGCLLSLSTSLLPQLAAKVYGDLASSISM